MYFFLLVVTEDADFLLSPALEVTWGEPSRSTSVSRTVIVTRRDLLLAGGVASASSSSICFLFPREVEALADFEGTSNAPSSDITSRLATAVDLLPLPRPLFGGGSSVGASLSSVSTSSTRVGRGVMEPAEVARAVSTSSALTEVLCLLLLGVRLGVAPEMRPPSGAELSSTETPDSRLDLLTGVNG